MPQELNSPILIPRLLVRLWSTLRLVAGLTPVGVVGRGGRRCGPGVLLRLLPGSGWRTWRWEMGRGPGNRSESAPGPHLHPGEGESTIPHGGKLEAGPVVGRARLREA